MLPSACRWRRSRSVRLGQLQSGRTDIFKSLRSNRFISGCRPASWWCPHPITAYRSWGTRSLLRSLLKRRSAIVTSRIERTSGCMNLQDQDQTKSPSGCSFLLSGLGCSWAVTGASSTRSRTEQRRLSRQRLAGMTALRLKLVARRRM